MKGGGIALRYDVAGITTAAEAAIRRQRRLRRLPHVFSRVLELPLAADADVSITEDSYGFRFSAATAADAEIMGDVSARTVEIIPGVVKVVVRTCGDYDDGMDINKWRFRLPPCTLPAMARAVYADGDLVVDVPKGANLDEGYGGDGLAGGSAARLIVIQ